jgi:aminomethyltransferase
VKWPALDAGVEIGLVTSAIHSPRLGKNIGYCWLPTDRSTDGSSVSVQTEWGTRNATVVPMPFVDPDKAIPVS